MDIRSLREKINRADDQLVSAFKERMEIALEIARYKKANGLAIHDPARERAVVERLTEGCDESLSGAIEKLYETLFELSREQQRRFMAEDENHE
ncbi:MAG: chorismate mutase [Clostridia bacterium]|nr:chorismate mutase [Clostridia bacterium]